ncbi:UNVERIFIED_CONTAM: hypothetical protein RMT77_019694 [Armadillidium vulgare]
MLLGIVFFVVNNQNEFKVTRFKEQSPDTKVKVLPGLILEVVGGTKFINCYLDIYLDLRSNKFIYDNLNVNEGELIKY